MAFLGLGSNNVVKKSLLIVVSKNFDAVADGLDEKFDDTGAVKDGTYRLKRWERRWLTQVKLEQMPYTPKPRMLPKLITHLLLAFPGRFRRVGRG